MTRPHQVEGTLRSLGLSGMLDTLDVRLSQAHAGELGHLEFLQALCEDEIARREAGALLRRVRAAHFEETVTIEEFDFAFNPKVPAALIRDLATLRFLEAGKTMIAQALGHGVCRRGYSISFTKTSRLLSDLAGGHADRSFEARLRRFAPAEGSGRPAGHVWLVRLRRGEQAVELATGLGRPSAEYLARQVSALLEGRPLEKGGAMR